MGNLNAEGARITIGARTLLDDVNLEIRRGEVLAIVGPNGVGKTTLLRTLAGVLAPAGGRVTIEGIDLRERSRAELVRAIALVSSDVELPHGMSVRDVVATGRFAHRAWWDWSSGPDDDDATAAAIARCDLGELAERPFDTLSSGERQRAWLAVGLAQGANVLLLDEPTSHLDARYAVEMLALLRRIASEGRAVAAVLHDLNEAAAFADRIAVLGERSLIACGPPALVLLSPALERAYGVPFERFERDGRVRVTVRGEDALTAWRTEPIPR
ncbi:MAG: ABC transporter ATP-binding protein [Candidatus Eremiobacteraeota bacterium]|nr:ABC transporter ATP-binding protein [Candidatus Eremiobacteraeota bacterium]